MKTVVKYGVRPFSREFLISQLAARGRWLFLDDIGHTEEASSKIFFDFFGAVAGSLLQSLTVCMQDINLSTSTRQ